MEGEFNDLKYNNTNITFSQEVNNTATSDELTAALMYQDKMGTNYSRSKKYSKVISAAGIAILLTAASVKAGSVITNAFVLNPPSVVSDTYKVEDISNIIINNVLYFILKSSLNDKKNYAPKLVSFTPGTNPLAALGFINVPSPFLKKLPPEIETSTYTLVLDLDETLVHFF